MSVLTIRQALANGDKAIINQVAGTINKIFPQNQTQTGKAVQNIILSDGDAEVKVVLWARDAIQTDWEGTPVVLSSVVGRNNHLTGVTVKAAVDYKTKQPTFELHVSETAKIEKMNGQASPVIRENTPAPLPGSVRDSAPAAANDPRIQSPAPKATLDDIAALYGQAYRIVRATLPLAEGVCPDGPTLQAVQAGVATIFISAKDNGLLAGAAKRDPVVVAGKITGEKPF